MKALLRLAELLQKETLTAKERHEGVALAEAMFGYGSLHHLDAVRVALRSKKLDASTISAEIKKEVVEKLEDLNKGDVYSTRDTARGVQYLRNGKLCKKADYLAAVGE